VAQKVARTLYLVGLIILCGGLLGSASLGKPRKNTAKQADAHRRARQCVFFGGHLSDEQVITFTATLAAARHPGVVLLDSAKFSTPLKNFLAAFQPAQMVPVGSFPGGITDLERRLNVTAAPAIPWARGPPVGLWKSLFPRARRVVVCPAGPRPLLLQSACLAGILRAPLVILNGRAREAAQLRRQLEAWGTERIYAVGAAGRICRGLTLGKVRRLTDEDAVAGLYLEKLARRGPVRTLVVANPADTAKDFGGMSALAPWVAWHKRAVLLLTNEAGDNVEAVVQQALRSEHLRQADALVLVGNLKAIPMERRPNPIPTDKDKYIEMEPLTPRGSEPFSFATGRLFNEDPAVVALLLARERLLKEQRTTERKVLVVSNPAGGLPLLEAFSRNTTKEFRNAGYQTTALFGHDVTKNEVRRLLPEQDIFLWEGHHNTLVREYCVQEWPEPLRPALIFLQSCLALAEPKAQPFLQRGAIGVVGSSTRTYSGSGGACALAFFDALNYEHQSLGGSLRHAKNFLLAYALLKDKRLGKAAKKSGANIRTAWAFTLWGDPTVKLPRVNRPARALDAVSAKVRHRTIIVTLPPTAYPKVVTAKYQTEMRPNGRMAGLLRKGDENGKRLVPFVFAEVRLRKSPFGKKPRLTSRIPRRHWVFCWDARRKVGYLLVTPRAKDREELRFHVKWEEAEGFVARSSAGKR
jgi:hypothetical protein